MNAPHPIRAAYGHLPMVASHLVESVAEDQPVIRLASGVDVESFTAQVQQPSPHERGLADGMLIAGMSGLDSLLEGLNMAAWYVERATQTGAGQAYDLGKLQRIAERLAEIHQKVDMSAGRLTAKLAGAR